MGGTDNIPFEHLVDWLEGRLSAKEAAAVALALASLGPDAQGDAAWLQAFHEARARLRLDKPPPALHAALVGQYRPPLLQGLARRAAALLTFDSAAAPLALAGLRAGELRARQLVFTCDLLEVALNMRPSRQGDHLDLNGQIFPRDLPAPENLLARLSRGGELVDVSPTDALGEFQFVGVAPGDYTLDLLGEGGEVAIETFAVQLGPPQ